MRWGESAGWGSRNPNCLLFTFLVLSFLGNKCWLLISAGAFSNFISTSSSSIPKSKQVKNTPSGSTVSLQKISYYHDYLRILFIHPSITKNACRGQEAASSPAGFPKGTEGLSLSWSRVNDINYRHEILMYDSARLQRDRQDVRRGSYLQQHRAQVSCFP